MRWDVLLPVLVYFFITFLAVFYSRKLMKKGTGNFQEEFFVGGRSLGAMTLVFTLIATSASAGTFIGDSGLGYDVGFSWIGIIVAQIPTGVFVLGILGKKYAIVSRRIQAVTVMDVLRKRYRSAVVVLGGSIGILVFLMAYMVAQFSGGARILESITGLPYQTGILIFGVFIIAYTAIAGFRGVALTDLIQGMIMILGGIILWVFFMVKTDGYSAVMNQLVQTNPEMVTLPGPFGTTPALMFSYFLLLGVFIVALPHNTVRAMTYRDSKTMHKAIMYSCIVYGLFTFGFSMFGPVAKALYPDLAVADMAVPTLMMGLMPGWVAGIALSAPMAAIMSTVNSMLLVASSTIVKDFYLNYHWRCIN